MNLKKRGQAWSFDLVIATFLFTIGILGLYLYFLNTPEQNQDEIDSLFYEGNTIAGILLTEGYPLYWTVNDVSRIGIISDNKINDTKLSQFYELSKSNYKLTQNLFRTKYNYFVSFDENLNLNGTEVEGIGKKEDNPKNLVTISRFVIYKEKPATIKIKIWE